MLIIVNSKRKGIENLNNLLIFKSFSAKFKYKIINASANKFARRVNLLPDGIIFKIFAAA